MFFVQLLLEVTLLTSVTFVSLQQDANDGENEFEGTIEPTCEPEDDCLKPQCYEPMVRGPCKANIPQFYYNNATGLCQKFKYGGCNGNKNRFNTITDCRRTCGSRQKTPVTDMCLKPFNLGMCNFSVERYYFDWVLGDCVQFNYSGCHGNENNFNSLEECRVECAKGMNADHRKHFCSLPAEKGPCYARVYRYFYNVESKKCERFTYGSCEGNLNNFKTEEDCEKACASLFED